MEWLALPPGVLAYAALAVFAAAFVRGYSGFGSSMIWVSSLAVVLPPAEVVPMVLLFEVAASLGLLPAVWREVQWRSLRWIVLGTLLATPAGVYALANLPANAIRLAIAAVVIVATLLIWRGRSLHSGSGALPAFATGLGAGLLNGSTGAGGPPVILFYFGSDAVVAVGRASIIAYFLASDALGTGFLAAQGLVTAEVLLRTLVALPLIGLGIWIGHRGFRRGDPARFKRLVLLLLIALSLALVARAFWVES
ncbi:MAG: sulfite exporter TauE/SafE family protein [Kiloniellales bacterium]